jgi:hypothetical protein
LLCNRCFRWLVKKILKQRIRSILLLFVPEEYNPHVWSLLNSSKSCVMGGVVASIMTGTWRDSFHVDTAPMQLDIVILSDLFLPSSISCWDQFLRAMDYQVSSSHIDAGSYLPCVGQIKLYSHPVCVTRCNCRYTRWRAGCCHACV